MRDKASIRKFCEELTNLWEEKNPNMRFGQMVVFLHQALDKPRHDIFYLEEEEMLNVLRASALFQQTISKSLAGR